MINVIKEFNELDGKTVSRVHLRKIINQAKKQNIKEVQNPLLEILQKEKCKYFKLTITNKIKELDKTTIKQPKLEGTAEEPQTIDFNKGILQAKRKGLINAKIFDLGNIKGVLKKYIGSGSLIVTGATLKKSMNKDSDHIAQWYHFINLPDAINKPHKIFKSKTKKDAFVILTEIQNAKEKPLMVAIHIEKNRKGKKSGSNSLIRLTVLDCKINKKLDHKDSKKFVIASIYAKKKYNIYDKWEKEGLLLYKKEEKIKQNNKINSLQSFEDLKGFNRTLQNFDFGKMNTFLGDIEIKPFGSVVMTLDASAGAGKTRFLFQLMNQIAKKYKCLFVSLEEHPQSQLFQNKIKQYIDPQNMSNIFAVGQIKNKAELNKLSKQLDCIFIDSWGKLPNMELDDYRNTHNGKFIVSIFQRTTAGTMRGGTRAGFDADIIAKVEQHNDYKNNVVYFEKNRYNAQEKVYNIFEQKIM